ncbi:MAG: DUF454 family protein [Salinivirgaceae bacterium]|nr:DUF454 family protein [Salinivirgaceae bacterium]MDD4748293.1 DUF454 family protein [Salinivirgaceae bacterium]
MRRYLYIIFGIVCTLVGIIGIFVPLLPTTPLLLAAVYFFSHSSPVLQRIITQNRFLNSYINPYIRKLPIPMRIRIRTIIILWLTLLISSYFMRNQGWGLILMGIVGVGVTIHVLTIRRGFTDTDKQ